MRPSFIVALLCAVLTLSCSPLIASPVQVQPPRSLPLQTVIADSYDNDIVRVDESVWLKLYDVDAEGGLEDIRKELDRLGPWSDVANRRFDGLTTWGLRWGFTYNDTTGSCSLRSATIEIEAVITLPELKDLEALPAGQSVMWQGYVQQLRSHEDGHVNNYRAGAQELSNEVLQLGAMPDCNQLRQALNALGEAKIARIRQADVNYDLLTGHGAVFPRPN
jgi:predicted secreted Zn-dependent protease